MEDFIVEGNCIACLDITTRVGWMKFVEESYQPAAQE